MINKNSRFNRPKMKLLSCKITVSKDSIFAKFLLRVETLGREMHKDNLVVQGDENNDFITTSQSAEAVY